MKNKIHYILIAAAIFGFLLQAFYFISLENRFLEKQIKTQEAYLVEGLKGKWKDFLLSKARQKKLSHKYELKWNRNGTEPRHKFFPDRKTELDWAKYHKYVEESKTAEVKNFLLNALKRHNSWDKVLAVAEWKKLYTQKVPAELSAYEETLVNTEAKEAYRLIFAQFDGNNDFTFTGDETEFDKVFYYLDKEGSIVAFVPSVSEIRDRFLNQFLSDNNLTKATLGGNPWDISFSDINVRKNTSGHAFALWSLICSLLLVAGLFRYYKNIGEHKKELLRKVSFLNQVVHEVKTPLTGLKLHLQLIQNGLGNQDNYEALNTSINRINKVFDDIVLMNRPLQKAGVKKTAKHLLNEMLAEFKTDFKELVIENYFEADVLTDLCGLRLILKNLIENAIRYGKFANISIVHSEKEVIIYIKDKGPGITRQESKNIFREFYRSESAKKITADGLGLGLHLAKKLAAQIGSDIRLDNPGVTSGAVFKITLPSGA